MSSTYSFRSTFLRFAVVACTASLANAAEPTRIVFQNGRSVQISAVALQGERLVIRSSADGFNEGQAFALASADHVFGEKPAGTNSGIALLLMGIPREVLGSGTFLEVRVMPASFEPWVVMVLPPGGFFMIAALLLVANWHDLRRLARDTAPSQPARKAA